MATVQLKDLAYARSGDKGDICNVGLIALNEENYHKIIQAVTAEKIKEHFGSMVTGEVYLYPMPNLNCLQVVMYGALGGGATRTLRYDQTGKAMSTALLRMEVDINE
jgi:hypothetical protein